MMTIRNCHPHASSRRRYRAWAWGILLAGALGASPSAQQAVPGTTVRGWHHCWFDTEVTRVRAVDIDVYYATTAVRRTDGQVFVRGDNGKEPCFVPPLPPGVVYVDVALGELCVGLRSDGQVVQWGYLAAITPHPVAVAGSPWVKVASAGAAGFALRSDGAIDAWGNNTLGQCNVPPLAAGLHYVDVRGGGSHIVGLVSDGPTRVHG